jgi:hypothetical protein
MAFAPAFPSHGFAPSRAHRKPKRSIFRDLIDAMILARQREAERQIADYLERTGGKFTDESEREIERRLMQRANW